MKTITISTENSETYSSISNFFIDYYMTDANGEFVKVYLYLIRLLNSNKAVSVAAIADHFNLTENDICRAIKYWISKDVVRLNYDGNGSLSGIVLLPLHAPSIGLKTDSDAVSILKVVSDNTPKSSGKGRRKNEPPEKPDYTKTQLASAFEDTELADIQYLIETLFGKPLTPSNCATVLYIYDSLEFSADLFEYLVEYCVEMKKTNFRYMEAVAIAWYNEGIKSRKDAKYQSSTSKSLCSMVFRALGIRQRIPTDTESAFINTWSKDYGFTDELIKTACDKAILAHPDSANFSYVNAIMENWHRNNVKTLDDVAKLDQEHIAKTINAKSAKDTGNISSFNNFKQTKLDNQLAEMEELFLREVNN